MSESENERGTESNNTNDAEHVNVPERRRSVQSTSRAAASSSTSSSRPTDVLDAARYLRGLLSSSDNTDTDALLLFNVRSLKEVVLSSFDSVERIAKFLKSDEANDQNGTSHRLYHLRFYVIFLYVAAFFSLNPAYFLIRLIHRLSFSAFLDALSDQGSVGDNRGVLLLPV